MADINNERELRVVFCTYDSPQNIAGPNVWLLRLLPKLKEFKISPSVLVFSLNPSDSPMADALSTLGIKVAICEFKTTTRRKIKWILSQISKSPVDIFVPNHVIPAFYAAAFLRKAGIPTVGVLHSDELFYHSLLDQFAVQPGFFRVSGLVCVSEFLRSLAARQTLDKVPISKIPCGVPIPNAYAVKPKRKLSLIYVGRLEEEQKRISEVTKAFCSVTKQLSGVDAYIYGDGPAFPSVRRIIGEEDAGDRVKLIGRVSPEEIQLRMLESHVIVLLSAYEGLPVALMEGMACGLVPVCRNISSGVPELIEHNVNGLLVTDESESLVSAVRQLKEQLGLWVELSKNARQKITDEFSNDSCAIKWNGFLREMAGSAITTVRLDFGSIRYRLPALRQEFMREDFRGHPLFARILHKVLRTIRPDLNAKLSD